MSSQEICAEGIIRGDTGQGMVEVIVIIATTFKDRVDLLEAPTVAMAALRTMEVTLPRYIYYYI